MTNQNFATHKEPRLLSAKTETIVNPVTGDRLTILHPSRKSRGNYTKIRFDLPPGAKGSPLHYHTKMDETFTVLKGCLEMEVGQKGHQRLLLPGESLKIPAGMHHSFCNTSNDWVTFTTENCPADGFEQFIRGLYGLAIDGKVNSEGIPTNLLQLAILLKLADTFTVGIPKIVFRLAIDILVGVAKVFNLN